MKRVVQIPRQGKVKDVSAPTAAGWPAGEGDHSGADSGPHSVGAARRR